MRVTQNMLTNSNLSYISKNYERLGKLQDQINTGKKITRPSDDPVVAMKGMRYRSQLTEVKQFYRNLTEGFTWLENTDSALNETTKVLERVRELVVQASNDTYDSAARGNIAKEIEQLQKHLASVANTKVGENYIFNGTDIGTAPVKEDSLFVEFNTFKSDIAASAIDPENYVVNYQGYTFQYDKDNSTADKLEYKSTAGNTITIDITTGDITHKYTNTSNTTTEERISGDNLAIANKNAISTNTQDFEVEVMKGVKIPVNVRPQDAFSIELFSGLESIKKMLVNPDTKGTDITKALESLDKISNGVVSTRSELGARQNRAELVENRLQEQKIIAEKTVSDNEDIDFEQAIIDLITQEGIHRASLAAGARIIQPTLMDFLR
ncbi:flagellar hook-associated protein FlgL [Schinkia azotoformans]|uniref:flagellar hook-associated protein FlgL n=1 Tax=Schinkia azotoformans TaxID=1454 RepID=UPI002DB66629|nr:flagellar hook-associated protein FlgL [Schinkia azotoformans]MEC1715531.1 flagellar hook-associated protein FlgL [Schinkia azotoformans]MEC1743417.1 flagellar hook-associated protein FlgL [Schinkia azotoformans]MEC1747989.1 flagellar hook-associated protein FlgL [Schinkia azotoformans]MEC1758352.1 flagellar hook-associated protein FlgL [Schinkia azotoformans]MEC1768359.1 flagellar hook-associated protein FlgL [Schinkia azotoformans]